MRKLFNVNIKSKKVAELYRRIDMQIEVVCLGTIVREDYIIRRKLFSKIKCEKAFNPMYEVGKTYTVYAGDIQYIKTSNLNWGLIM